MSKEMPRFAMPPAAPQVSTSDAPSRHGTASLTADGPSSGLADGGQHQRVGFGWRHLLILGLVCALIGAAIPLSVQAAERAAADTREADLHAVASLYLNAIAAGESETATSLVPPRAGSVIAPAEVLASATPITEQEVGLVQVDGDAGLAQVRYRVRVTDYSRLLEATLFDDGWQITTTLAEPILLSAAEGSSPTIGGIEVGLPSSMLLYPGAYVLDVSDGPVNSVGGDAFVVDGMQGTTTSVSATAQVRQSILDLASERALAHASACIANGACGWPSTAIATADGSAYSFGQQGSRFLILQVPLQIVQGGPSANVQVEVQLIVDEVGTVTGASCSGLTGFSEEPVDCMG